MSNRKLLILGVVAAMMVVLTVLQARLGREPARETGAGSYLIQGLDTSRIGSIEIGKGDNPTRLVRQGNRFVVANKDNYPAAVSKINTLLTSCLDIRTIELITRDPANYESLDVTEAKSQNVVKFLDGGGQVITGVVIGSSRLPELEMSKRSAYVRLVSGSEVYEAVGVPLAGGSALDYVEKEIVDVSRSDVVKVTVTGPDGSYTLRVPDGNDEDNIVLEDMPEGKKLKTSDAGGVLGALSYLSLSDVKRESSFGEGGLEFDTTYVSHLKDFTVYTLEIAKKDGKTYVKCSAEYTGKTREILRSQEGLEDKEAKLVARDRAMVFTKQHQGWVYEISEWKANNLTKKRSDLLEDEEKGDEADSSSVPEGSEEKSEEG
ncbi:MAG: DUF4340 domain-containing protein [Planctomycetota bacterium]|jgi:hypothetical protein